MTFDQAMGFAILAASMVMFVWNRFRYDFVALAALCAALVTGVVKPDQAFDGFASEVVVIIAAALVLSAAIARSGVIEPVLRPLLKRFHTPATQVPVLAGATAAFSMAFKNVGALATLMPVAVRMGRGEKSSASALLMPMSFMALLGGLVTLVGTSTNIIASDVRQQMTGKPFALLDFAPVGLTLTAVGLVFVSFAWRLLPTGRKPKTGLGDVTADKRYSTEAVVPSEGWPKELATIADLDLGNVGVQLTGIIGPGGAKKMLLPDTRLVAGMTLILHGDDETLSQLFQRAPLDHARSETVVAKDEDHEEIRTVEAVIEAGSPLVGRTASQLELQDRFHAKLLGISRYGERISERLQATPLREGDLLILQAAEGNLPTALVELGALPLAERTVNLGNRRHRYGPILILAAAMLAVAFKVLPVAEAFFVAAVLVVAIGSLTMREAYGALEPEVLVLIGALVPLSHALQENGGTALVAQMLSGSLANASPLIVVGGFMLAAMISSPFLHNAPTVLVLAPIGAAVAQHLGLNPDAALMAVATGAGCDFVTPVGHQCNTLVRGPGGYRFFDYIRLGAPLSVAVLAIGVPTIMHFWL